MSAPSRTTVARRGTLPAVVVISIWMLQLLGAVAPVRADEKADQAAAAAIADAKKSLNEKQYAPARDKFNAYIKTYPAGKDLNSARFALALLTLDGPRVATPAGQDRDYLGAIELLKPVLADAAFADRAMAIYYSAQAQRDLGLWTLKQIAAKPAEAAQLKAAAAQQFDAAGKQFIEAVHAFVERAKATPAAPAGDLPPDYEWAARARCDVADILLRTGKPREAAVIAQPFIKDPVHLRSQSRDLGRYLHGFASYTAGDTMTAARSLSLLAPFKDPEFGGQARFLLARIHHAAAERPEAAALYESLLTDFDAQVASARGIVNDANALKDNPRERTRLENLVRDPAPDHIEKASFHYATLMLELGQNGPAAERLMKFVQQYPKSPLMPEVHMRLGTALTRLKQYVDAIKVLSGLAEHPVFSYEAKWNLGRCWAGNFDPANAAQKQQALTNAVTQYRAAADAAAKANEPNAKLNRTDILLELADTQLGAGLPKDAAATYQQLVNDKVDAERVEQAHQRLVAALHLAGMYAESDAAVASFVATYPKSTLLAPVLFRHAENAFAQAEAAAKVPDAAAKPQAWRPAYEESIKRYDAVLAKYPDFGYAHLARFGQAMSLYKLQQYEKAIPVLSAIGSSDRSGELAIASYVQADCLLRTAPTNVDDAISAGRALQQVTEAIKHLEAFIPGNEARPEGALATLQVADCYLRVASIMADPAEKAKATAAALAIFVGFPTKFGANHALVGHALLGRCNTIAMQGDAASAMQRLVRFQNQPPYPTTSVAPLALLRLATMMQAQNRAAEAVPLLAAVRQQHESALLKDPQRAAWVPTIQYHHALALKETGKLTEAQAIFESVVKTFPQSNEAGDAAWRAGQCKIEITKAAIDAASAALAKPETKPEDAAKANAAIAAALAQLKEAVTYFDAQEAAAAQKARGGPAHLRMLYESAWLNRALGDREIEAAIRAKQADSITKREALAKAAAAPNQPPAKVYPIEVPAASIPLQPSQQKAIDKYKAIIDAASDAALAILARLELAELYAERGQLDLAVPMLTDAIDLEPEPALAERIHLRLGATLLERGDIKGATEHFASVAQSKTPAVYGEAHYRLAETKLAAKDFPAALALLVLFRDKGEFQNIPGVSDRAMLRLGDAYAYAAQPEPSRQAYENLIGRFGGSPHRFEARYQIAIARIAQKNFDDAINHLREAAKAGPAGQTALAAKAEVAIAACLIEKGQFAPAIAAAMPVTYIYDVPQVTAAALIQAGRGHFYLNQLDKAKELYTRVVKEFPNTPAAAEAQKFLDTPAAPAKK